MVAAVVLQLTGERRLGLDDPVERPLPGVLANGRRVTIRHLLNHTSGVFDVAREPRLVDDPRRDPQVPVPALELVAVAAERGPQFPLGTRWSYSNTNYLPLGLIAERATGVPIEAQLQRRLFRPLRMTRTTLPRTLTIPVSARPGATPAAWT